jgi:hypothetical protein
MMTGEQHIENMLHIEVGEWEEGDGGILEHGILEYCTFESFG